VRVIDNDFLWRQEKGPIFDRGGIMRGVSKYYKGSSVDVVRPPIIRFPVFDLVSIVLFHPYIIYRQIRDYKPDVVFGFGILNTFFANIISKILNVPFVYYLIDSLHTLLENNVLEYLAKSFEKMTLKNSKHVFTINKALSNYATEMGAKPENVKVIPAGIDLDKYEHIDNRDNLRNDLGIKKNDIVLFFMGWLYAFSGILEVAQSMNPFSDMSFKLLIVGEGDIYEELRELSLKNSNIILTGRVPYNKIPHLLACSDICLLPAYENKIMHSIVPIKIYEYMASSKPVIATELNGLVQEFGYDSGIIYVKSPYEVLDRALAIFKRNLVDKLGNESLKNVKNNSWENIVATFENNIQNIYDKKIVRT